MGDEWIPRVVFLRCVNRGLQFAGEPSNSVTEGRLRAALIEELYAAVRDGQMTYPEGGFENAFTVKIVGGSTEIIFANEAPSKPKPKPEHGLGIYEFMALSRAVTGAEHPEWPRSNDDIAWRMLQRRAFAKLSPRDADAWVRDVKRLRHNFKLEYAKEAGENARIAALRPGVWAWIEARWTALSKDEPCVDNHRWADKHNSNAVRRYYKQRSHGCCGFSDVEEVCPVDGKTYLLGINFGH